MYKKIKNKRRTIFFSIKKIYFKIVEFIVFTNNIIKIINYPMFH